MIITLWSRQKKNDEGVLVWEFNHISDGFDENQTTPAAVTPEQGKGWAKSKWSSLKAQLIDGKVVH